MFSRIDTTTVIISILITFSAFAATAKWLEGRIGATTLVDDDRLELRIPHAGNPVIVYRPPASADRHDRRDPPEPPGSRDRKLQLNSPGADKDERLTTEQLAFHRNPPLLTWVVLVAGMVGLSAALLLLLPYTLMKLRTSIPLGEKRLLHHQYGLMLASLLALFGVGLPIIYSTEYAGLVTIVDWYVLLKTGLLEPAWTVHWLQGLTALPGVVALFGMFVASSTADDIVCHVDGARDPLARMDVTVQRYRDVKFAFRLCLASASALLVMTVLTTGALREALLTATAHEHPWIAPTEFLYLYGLLFAVVLAMVYLPIYFHVRVVGKRIHAELAAAAQGVCNGRGDDGDDGHGTDDPLAEAREILTGQESVGNKLLSWISIAAPVLGTILPDLISF